MAISWDVWLETDPQHQPVIIARTVCKLLRTGREKSFIKLLKCLKSTTWRASLYISLLAALLLPIIKREKPLESVLE